MSIRFFPQMSKNQSYSLTVESHTSAPQGSDRNREVCISEAGLTLLSVTLPFVERSLASRMNEHPLEPDSQRFRAAQLMLPDTHHRPARTSEAPGHAAVSCFVSGNLLVPKLLVGCRPFIATGASMPKASINKHSEPFTPKDEVRSSKNRLVTSPAGDALLPEQLAHRLFRSPVPSGLDSAHALGAFLIRKEISHSSSSLHPVGILSGPSMGCACCTKSNTPNRHAQLTPEKGKSKVE